MTSTFSLGNNADKKAECSGQRRGVINQMRFLLFFFLFLLLESFIFKTYKSEYLVSLSLRLYMASLCMCFYSRLMFLYDALYFSLHAVESFQ